MKAVAVLCNVVLFLFTCLVLVTDGVPREMSYVVFSLVLLLIPAVTAFVLVRGASRTVMVLAAVCNVVLLARICWAYVQEYPHPSEPGFVPYMIVAVATPILSVVALLRAERTAGQRVMSV